MGDVFSSHLTTVLPDGSTEYDFNGHIKAAGLDFDVGDPGSTEQVRSDIVWRERASGALVAEIVATVQQGLTKDRRPNRLVLDAKPATNGHGATIDVVAGDQRETLLTDTGGSGFARVAESLRIVRGVISSAGAAVEGRGYTVTRTATGTYSLTWIAAFSAPPAVIASPFFDRLTEAQGTTTGAVIRCKTPAGALSDVSTNFIAIGPP